MEAVGPELDLPPPPQPPATDDVDQFFVLNPPGPTTDLARRDAWSLPPLPGTAPNANADGPPSDADDPDDDPDALAEERLYLANKDALSAYVKEHGVPTVAARAGLKNKGNTCYLNALLQGIHSVKPIADLILGREWAKGGKRYKVELV